MRRPRHQCRGWCDAGNRDLVRVGAVTEHRDPPGSQFGRAPTSERDCPRVVETHDEGAAGTELLGELVEDRDVGLDAAEEVEVVDLDVGDHDDVRRVFE